MHIYGLFDPITYELRYVGCTVQDVKRRLAAHLYPASLIAQTHKNAWLKKLIRYGLRPEVRIVHSLVPPATVQDLKLAEVYWIGHFKGLGCRLTNGTNGGDGNTHPSVETRMRMSNSHMGHIVTPETRAKMSAAQKGKTHSPETIAKLSIIKTGIRATPETRAILSQKQRDRYKDPEQRAKARINLAKARAIKH